MSFVAISSVLCRCFKAMSLVEILPQQGLSPNDVSLMYSFYYCFIVVLLACSYQSA